MFALFRKRTTTSTATCSSQLRCCLSLEGLDERSLPASFGFVGLGSASDFAVLGINGGSVTMNSSHIIGNVGLGAGATSVLQKTDLTGKLVADPAATADLSKINKDFIPAGGVVTQSLAQAVSDANAASARYAAMPARFNLGNLTSSLTIPGNGATTVVNVASVSYNGQKLTLSGGAADVFVINVTGSFAFANSKIVLAGSVTPNHVLFNFPTTGPEIDLYKASNVINGTFLAPQRSLEYHNPASFNGAVIAKSLNIHSDAQLNNGDPTPTPPAAVTSTLSGTVYNFLVSGLTVTLTGTDSSGKTVTLTTTTDDNGQYSFSGVAAGTYTITLTFEDSQYTVSSISGSLGGNATGSTITLISLNGVDGIGYDFIINPLG